VQWQDIKADFSREAVFTPSLTEVFEGSECLLPFSWELDGPKLAWWLSCLAHLCYFSPDEITSRLDALGLSGSRVVQGATQRAIVIRYQERLIVAVQGSASPEDALLDADFYPAKIASGRVHRGFLRAYEQLKPQLLAECSQAELAGAVYCGHSLGGAISLLTASHYGGRGVWTFGAPRVGNADFITSLKLPVTRYVNSCDIVPRVPPGLFGFRQKGELHYIDCHLDLHEAAGWRQRWKSQAQGGLSYWASGGGLRPGRAPLRSLADHAPINYSRALRRYLLRQSASGSG